MAQTASLSNADPVVRRTADLLEQLFPSPRNFGIRLYMSASVYRFESGSINVNQTLLAKMTRAGKSNVPFSRADVYSEGELRSKLVEAL